MILRRRSSIPAALVLAVAIGMVLASPSLARAEKAIVQAFLADDGSGELWVQEAEREGRGWRWEACDVALTRCDPYAKGSEATTGAVAPETVFRARSGAGSTGTSPVWHGNVKSIGAPAVRGEARANELVTPVAGRWSGGWDGDHDWLQLAACSTPSGEDCITLTDQHYNGSCANEAAVIDPEFVGDYLRVADRRVDAEAGILLYAVGSPYSRSNAWEPGPLVAAAVVGRIKPANGPRAAKCGPPPIVARASISKGGVAKIDCSLGCRATLLAEQGGRRARARAREVFSDSLRLPARKARRFGSRLVRLTVLLDGRAAAHRSVRLPLRRPGRARR